MFMSNNLDIAKKHFEVGSKKLDPELYKEAEKQFILSRIIYLIKFQLYQNFFYVNSTKKI